MTRPRIIERHAVAIRTDGDVVAAVVAPTLRDAHDALISARFEYFHGSVDDLADEIEREHRYWYTRKMVD